MSELTKEISSGEHKEVLWDKNGLLFRKWDEENQDYFPEQMRIINKTISFTKDNWQTVQTAVGEYHYIDPSTNKIIETYGINAETVIGKLIMGEELFMTNKNGSMQFNSSGLSIDTKANGGSVLSIKKNGQNLLYVDTDGNVNFSGKLSGATGSFEGDVVANSFSFQQTITESDLDGYYMLGRVEYGSSIPLDPGMYIGTFYKKGEGEIGGSYNIGAGLAVTALESGYGDAKLTGEEITISSGDGGLNINGRFSSSSDSTFESTVTIKNGLTVEAGGISTDELDVSGGLTVSGSKSRIVETDDGTLSLHAYETPTPYFGDIGTGTLNEDGIDTVPIDYLFSNTINTNVEYAVFLQKEGQGDLWVDEKDPLFFVVKGTPNLKYSWELKAVQREYECVNLEESASELKLSSSDASDNDVFSELDDIISALDKEEDFYNESN